VDHVSGSRTGTATCRQLVRLPLNSTDPFRGRPKGYGPGQGGAEEDEEFLSGTFWHVALKPLGAFVWRYFSMKHRRLVGFLVSTAAVVCLSLVSIPAAFAGSAGQMLSLHDVYGSINTAQIAGDNQNCQYQQIDFPWPNHYLNTGAPYTSPDYWWQYYYGGTSYGVCDNVAVVVTAYTGTYTGFLANYTLYYNGLYYPPHNQPSSNWSSCQMDRPGGGIACAGGLETE